MTHDIPMANTEGLVPVPEQVSIMTQELDARCSDLKTEVREFMQAELSSQLSKMQTELHASQLSKIQIEISSQLSKMQIEISSQVSKMQTELLSQLSTMQTGILETPRNQPPLSPTRGIVPSIICRWQDTSHLRTEIDKLKIDNDYHRSQLESTRERARQNIEKLQGDNDQLRRDLEAAQTDARKALSGERARTQELTAKVNTFRQILTKADDQIPDDDIKMKFDGLRNLVQSLVLKCCGTVVRTKRERDRETHEFYLPFAQGRANIKTLFSRCRARVFAILVDEILGEKVFGLGPKYGDINRVLSKTEHMLDSYLASNTKEKANWRLASMKCAQLMTDHGTPTVSINTAAKILDFLWPILKKDKEGEAQTRAYKLCEEAYNVAVLMRKARDTWQVMTGDDITRRGLEIEEWIEEDVTEKSDQYTEAGIVCLLTAALGKIPEDHPETMIPMIKARAVYGRPN